jgi:hypothetical protein
MLQYESEEFFKIVHGCLLCLLQGIKYLMYGSDWIMLGREPEHERMSSVTNRLVREIGFLDAQVSRFFLWERYGIFGSGQQRIVETAHR